MISSDSGKLWHLHTEKSASFVRLVIHVTRLRCNSHFWALFWIPMEHDRVFCHGIQSHSVMGFPTGIQFSEDLSHSILIDSGDIYGIATGARWIPGETSCG